MSIKNFILQCFVLLHCFVQIQWIIKFNLIHFNGTQQISYTAIKLSKIYKKSSSYFQKPYWLTFEIVNFDNIDIKKTFNCSDHSGEKSVTGLYQVR